LGGKAAELYYFSILEKPAPPLLTRQTFFGVGKAGKASRVYHDALLKQGFQKRAFGPALGREPKTTYYREDLGFLEFQSPGKSSQAPFSRGLLSFPDPWVGLLLEDPHLVELKYLEESYSVWIPQTGRFILVNGLKVRTGSKPSAEESYRASQCLVLILYLLVPHKELEEEALNDLVEVRPASLLRELRQTLKDNGPGTPVWEGAQRFYMDLFPGSKAVQLTSWYWKFIPKLSKALEEQKAGD
jgi:hypothetical protein